LSLTVESDSDEASYPWTDKTPADFQSDVTVTGDKITGTLTFIEGGLAETGPLSGDGYFLALKWSDPAEGVTSLKVGLIPSEGTGLVECIDDTDRNGVFKITDKNKQKLVLIQSGNGRVNVQNFDLSGLVLDEGV
jgi:hypothetical protein